MVFFLAVVAFSDLAGDDDHFHIFFTVWLEYLMPFWMYLCLSRHIDSDI